MGGSILTNGLRLVGEIAAPFNMSGSLDVVDMPYKDITSAAPESLNPAEQEIRALHDNGAFNRAGWHAFKHNCHLADGETSPAMAVKFAQSFVQPEFKEAVGERFDALATEEDRQTLIDLKASKDESYNKFVSDQGQSFFDSLFKGDESGAGNSAFEEELSVERVATISPTPL